MEPGLAGQLPDFPNPFRGVPISRLPLLTHPPYMIMF